MSNKFYLIFALILQINFTLLAQDCSRVKKETDNLNSKITYSISGNLPISIQKIVKTNDTLYLAKIIIKTNKHSYFAEGVDFFLEGGERISKPIAKVSQRVISMNNYEIKSIFYLTKEEVLLLSRINIKEFRMHVYLNTLSPEQTDLFKGNLKCLLTFW